MDDAQLHTIWQQRQGGHRIVPLAEPLGIFMKHHLGRRVKQFGELAVLWEEAIPAGIRSHTSVEAFQRGVLTVLVDSAAHRFQLQTLLTGGLLETLQQRFHGSLNKIRLLPGRFYGLDRETGQKRYDV